MRMFHLDHGSLLESSIVYTIVSHVKNSHVNQQIAPAVYGIASSMLNISNVLFFIRSHPIFFLESILLRRQDSLH